MALLLVVGRRGQVLKECSVPNATTITYAAMHVADYLGVDPASGSFFLGEYPTMTPLPDDDIAADWDGKKVLFCRTDSP